MNIQECIICLSNENNLKEINTLNIFKSCSCVYDVHENCILEWIKTNPLCPICKKFLTNNIINDISININDTLIDDFLIDELNNEIIIRKNKRKKYIKIIILVIVLLLLVLILNIIKD